MLPASACFRQRAAQSCRLYTAGNLRPANEAPWLRPGAGSCVCRCLCSSLPRPKRHPPFKNYRLSNVSPEVRLEELAAAGFIHYPRIERVPTSIGSFREQWMDRLKTGEIADSEEYTVNGTISTIRSAGSKLCFVDLVSQPGNVRLQATIQQNRLLTEDAPDDAVRNFTKLIRCGDHISVQGKPYVTNSGDLSILATSIPKMMSPCLHSIPTTNPGGASDHVPDRHVELLATPSLMDTIVARAHLIRAMEDFLRSKAFHRVYTPILAASAGGATARPFKTTATEFSDRELALRISPELWLKRLIVGGMDRIFEIGPSFRNEGLDKTHNPEFTTCEFYATNWTLETLLTETQAMINDVAKGVEPLNHEFHKSIGKWPGELWPRIDFIPELNKVLGSELPDLSSPSAREDLLRLLERKSLPIPTTPTLPRLLDKLSSIYIEPYCLHATWIINIPECLSPLAKSFPHPDLPHQRVAARGELFIQGKEVVNCYEEENSPVEQKRKFLDQQRHARLPKEGETTDDVDDEAMSIDDDYIRCLEWGLPPTGGWGCGIDRLLMMMLGKPNIKDVLTFGNLRAVTRGAEKVSTGVENSLRDSDMSSKDAREESPDMTRKVPVDSEAPLEEDDAIESERQTELKRQREDPKLEKKRIQEELEKKFAYFKL